MKNMSCDDAKGIDMVEYLASLNHVPANIRGNNYWYLSPLREEKTPSFKVDRKKNVWYDHGNGKCGDLIDFGTLYHKCSIKELLEKLSQYNGRPVLSFGPLINSGGVSSAASHKAGEKKETTEGKIVVLDTRPLQTKTLLDYLEKRCIPLEIANRYCKEVDFLLYSKQHTVIGFANNSGGYELRNENFKGSSSPKDISFVNNKTEDVAVFEGFFSFLSFATINKNLSAPLSNCLILNSLSFFEKSRSLMEQHNHVHLILDRDNAGMNHTKQALTWNPDKYIDQSEFYRGRKDLNEWLIHRDKSLKLQQPPKHKRSF